jgi:D-ribose pyranase
VELFPQPFFMLLTGILNPHVSSLLARIRHTNTLVISDRGFPYWPQIETIDLSLVDGIPTVAQVVDAVLTNWKASRVFMAEEFLTTNDESTQHRFTRALHGVAVSYEPHVQLKLRVPHAIGLIRTGETIQYANMVLESG